MTAVGIMLTLAAYLALIGLDWRTGDVGIAVRVAAFVALTHLLAAGVVLTVTGEHT